MNTDNNYEKVTTIYESEQTRVCRGIDSNGKSVILKSLKQAATNARRVRNLKREYEILQILPEGTAPAAITQEEYQEELTIILADTQGRDLTRYTEYGTISYEQFLTLAINITTCLQGVHAAGYVHKDINPSNIIYHESITDVQLIDFGLSTPFGLHTEELFSHHNTLSGTLHYLSPEQTGRMNRTVDNRADFYSLGVTLYEILCGKRPFSGNDSLELIHAHIAKQAAPVSKHREDVPAAIENILFKLLSKNPNDRYQSCKGLLADLTECRTHLQSLADDISFPLGRDDYSNVFRIPQTLYGRKQELDILLQNFESVGAETKRIVAVSGKSGCGKTALVRELFHPITQKRGLFCSGKFDQYQNDQPHQAFVDSFRQILHWILSEEEQHLLKWKDYLLKSLGDMGSVLAGLLPELEFITGPLPKAPELIGEEAKHRFIYAVKIFLESIAKHLGPLVIFIDDCQWMDVGSKDVFHLLSDDYSISNVMLICAFRSLDTVGETPFAQVHSTFQRVPFFTEIKLGGLTPEHINSFVADTLQNTPETDSLARTVFQKTNGNPFFTTQFLLAAHKDHLITYDMNKGHWKWNASKIQAQPLAENVAEFMAHRLSQFSDETRQILQVGACLGHSFSQELLTTITPYFLHSHLSGILEIEIDDICESALIQGLLVRYNEETLGFAHDRIQEALYDSLAPCKRAEIHERAGLLIKENLTSNSPVSDVFDAAFHLNAAYKDVQINADRLQKLEEMNMIAARTATNSSAFDKAHHYYSRCISLLPENNWNTAYAPTLELYSSGAEAANLAGDFSRCQELCEEIFSNTKSNNDNYEATLVLMKLYHAQGDSSCAVKEAIKALGLYGLHFPAEPTFEDVGAAVNATVALLQNYDLDSVATMPTTESPKALYTMRIVAEIADAAYHAAPLLLPLMVCEQIRLSLEEGMCEESCVAFALMGIVLCAGGEYDMGDTMGKIALNLMDRFSADKYRSKVLLIANNCILHWKRDIRQSIEPLREAYFWGLKTGDQAFAASAIHCVWYNDFLSGRPLDELEKSHTEILHAIESINQVPQKVFHICYGQHFANLREVTSEPWKLTGKIMDEDEILNSLHATTGLTGLFVFHLNRAIVSLFFDHMDSSYEDILLAEEYLPSAAGLYLVPIFHQFKALIAFAAFRTSSVHNISKVDMLQTAETCIAALAPMAASCTENHAHRVKLLEAELAQENEDFATARTLYDQAADLALEYGHMNDHVIITLSAAKCSTRFSHIRAAKYYYAEALSDTRKWGAFGLAQHITEQYKNYLPHRTLRTNWDVDVTTSVSIADTTIDALDMGSVFKSVRALSTEMDSDRLLERTMSVIMENIGAERVVFIELVNNEFLVRTNGSAQHPTTLKNPIPLAEYPHAPHNVVRLAARNKKPLILEYPHRDSRFDKDKYIKDNRPLSILAFPAIHKGETVAIVYLEHSGMTDIFTDSRLKILEIFVGHAMVSLENARLYEQLKEYSHTLEERVAKRTEELENANRELHRLTLIDGLTGISNRRHFDDVMNAEWLRMTREQGALSLLLIDIDYFKQYNDTYGHQEGDECLIAVAQRLAGHARRPSDFVARYGGEEFAVVLPDTDANGALIIGEAIRKDIASMNIQSTSSGNVRHITASIGISTHSPTPSIAEEDRALIISQADKALYTAKETGRNKVCVFNTPYT
ncbi:MAG: diguanylate cyclase [Desulfovibrio sp.]